MNDGLPMSAQPWKTEQYFVSPWNYQPEVNAESTPSKKLEIHYVTLRDGEQQARVVKRIAASRLHARTFAQPVETCRENRLSRARDALLMRDGLSRTKERRFGVRS